MYPREKKVKKDAVNGFTRNWKIKNISQIIKVSEGNFQGIVSEPFVAFRSEARMKLCWKTLQDKSCLLSPSVELRVNYPINVMVRMSVQCSRFCYELQDGLPWTVVPDRVNVWENKCTLDLHEFLIDDSITVGLEMVHLLSADEQKSKLKEDMFPKDERPYYKMFMEGDRTDFSVFVDQREIKCHKCVLATTSTILEVKDELLNPKSLTIKDFEYQCIYEFIAFLYSMDESCLSMKKYAKQFLQLSNEYEVALLKAAAESYLISDICPANASAYSWIGLKNNAVRLRRKAEEVFLKDSDFALFVDDREIKCHKSVLSTTTTMLMVKDELLTPTSLTLKKFQFQCIYEFILFLYSKDENCLSMKKYVKHFLELADRYEVPLLKAAVESFLISDISRANAKAFAILGKEHNLEILRRKIDEFVLQTRLTRFSCSSSKNSNTDLNKNSNTNSNTDLNTNSSKNSNTDLNKNSNTNSNTDLNTNSNTNSNTDLNKNSNTNSNTDLNTNSNTNSNTDLNTNSNTNSNTDLNTNSNTNSNTDLNTNSNTNSNTDLNTNSNTNSSTSNGTSSNKRVRKKLRRTITITRTF